jgi:hypothetical protein
MWRDNMATYKIKLESISPLLMHGSQAIGEEDNKKRKGGEAIKGNPEEWKQSVYFDKKIGAFIPAVNFEACFVEAAKQFKVTGRQTATKFLKSSFFIDGDNIQLLVKNKPVLKLEDIEVDKRTVKNPATKMRNTRFRAKFMQWEIIFSAFVTAPDYLPLELLKNIIEYGGEFVGVCDFRPRFGRFKLVSIEQI